MYGTCCQNSSSLDKLFFDESENKFLYREHWISLVKSTIFSYKENVLHDFCQNLLGVNFKYRCLDPKYQC